MFGGMAMRYRKGFFVGIILFLSLVSLGFTEDFSLQYFLAKTQSKEIELSKKEKTELLNRMEGVMEEVQRINRNLIQAIQGGEVKVEYQEGKFWISKLEEDRGSIDMAIQQIKLLREKPNHLTASVKLYKSLKDLSSNFNAYNNISLFSAFVGDLAPEMELWADPVFYKLYLLPLAASRDKDMDKELSKMEKKPAPKK
jgi:hypothetical protein